MARTIYAKPTRALLKDMLKLSVAVTKVPALKLQGSENP